jgi:hypothetical protein
LQGELGPTSLSGEKGLRAKRVREEHAESRQDCSRKRRSDRRHSAASGLHLMSSQPLRFLRPKSLEFAANIVAVDEFTKSYSMAR